jgi:hypothetical protein
MEIKKTKIGFKEDLKNFLPRVAPGQGRTLGSIRANNPGPPHGLPDKYIPSRTGWFNPAAALRISAAVDPLRRPHADNPQPLSGAFPGRFRRWFGRA